MERLLGHGSQVCFEKDNISNWVQILQRKQVRVGIQNWRSLSGEYCLGINSQQTWSFLRPHSFCSNQLLTGIEVSDSLELKLDLKSQGY